MKSNTIGIYVGPEGTEIKKCLPEITKSILQILATSAGDDVKKKALEILQGAFKVENTHITGCTIFAPPTQKGGKP